ncbi:MAG: DUF4416 family protein [Candidatus Omnitrophota bacterium]|nr:DUF4416 family protein [Candidatus Omnitrophota bacterium]
MGALRSQDKVNLIVGLLSKDVSIFHKVEKRLGRTYGRIDFESGILDFTHTEYYKDEMGEGLKRKFVSFEKPVGLKNIWDAKIETNKLEKRFLVDGNRTVNIDPGYLTLSKLILFSTKDYSHRIYLNRGIFAEITLFYKDRRYNPWPWTYPDYRSKPYIDIFGSIRELYKKKISKAGIKP